MELVKPGQGQRCLVRVLGLGLNLYPPSHGSGGGNGLIELGYPCDGEPLSSEGGSHDRHQASIAFQPLKRLAALTALPYGVIVGVESRDGSWTGYTV